MATTLCLLERACYVPQRHNMGSDRAQVGHVSTPVSQGVVALEHPVAWEALLLVRQVSKPHAKRRAGSGAEEMRTLLGQAQQARARAGLCGQHEVPLYMRQKASSAPSEPAASCTPPAPPPWLMLAQAAVRARGRVSRRAWPRW